MARPSIRTMTVANIHTRMMRFAKAGDSVKGHKHTYGHATLLAHGALRIVVDGVASEFKAPHLIYTDKDLVHELIALEDNTVAACIHGLRYEESAPDLIDPDSVVVPEKLERLTILD